jgi:hypothetical protein
LGCFFRTGWSGQVLFIENLMMRGKVTWRSEGTGFRQMGEDSTCYKYIAHKGGVKLACLSVNKRSGGMSTVSKKEGGRRQYSTSRLGWRVSRIRYSKGSLCVSLGSIEEKSP